MSWKIVNRLRDVLSREKGVRVKDWGGRLPVVLAFPNSYHTGMSSLGFLSVYGMLADRPDVVAERVFLPDKSMAREYARTGTPLLSLENQRPLAEFEMIAFSISHENDYPNMVSMLEMAGVPARREDRGEKHPFVIAGGVCVRSNPEPIADFIDLALLGDGENILPPLIRAWRGARSNPLPKNERASLLARHVPGAYAPSAYEAALDGEGRLASFSPIVRDAPERVKVVRAEKLPSPALNSPIITPDTEFADTRLIEIGRGCPHGCRFCLAGFAYRPPRFADPHDVIAAVGNTDAPARKVGLVSPAVGDHPDLENMVRDLAGRGHTVTVSSLRVETLTPGLVEALHQGGLQSAAIAPEAGSQQLRDAINKGLTEEKIFEGVRLLAEAGLQNLKLYFMIGLPFETDRDVEAIADLAVRIHGELTRRTKKRKRMPGITLAVGSFVPKPHTPFESFPMAPEKALKKKARSIREGVRGAEGVRVHFDPPRWAYVQAALSRGDRRASGLVSALARGLEPHRALAGLDFDPDDFACRPMDEGLRPWDFIDHGVAPGFLGREAARAKQQRLTPECRPASCRLCGVCGEGAPDKG